jgi:hypothetical protein
MKVRITLIVVVLSALSLALPGITLAASGSGGGGGGKGGTATAAPAIPQIAGLWNGSYSYVTFATGAEASANYHQALMTLAEDSSGNLSGRFCLGAESPGCYLVKGKTLSGGAVEVQFDVNPPFFLDGNVAAMDCLDGSVGQVIDGGFTVREGTGGFTFNNCPNNSPAL